VLVVVITGPPGSGKSAVAGLAHDTLGEAGVANALIEADHVRRAHPPPAPGQVLAHIRTLLDSYAQTGHDLVFVTETLETAADLRALLAALAPADVAVVRLDAEPETVQARVLAREPETWSGRVALARHARDLAVSMRALPEADLVLATGAGRAVSAAAGAVLDLVAGRRGA
jgi:Zeta toxin